MGLPALQRFEHLSAVVEARSDDAVRAGEVVSFTLGKFVKSISEVVTAQNELRPLLLDGRKMLDNVTDDDFSALSISEVAKLRALMKRLARMLSRPMLARPTGTSLVSVAEALDGLRPATLGDRRLVLRQARRIRDSAEPCERERARFYGRLVDFIRRLDRLAAESEDPSAHEDAYMAALVTATKDRHPVINAYLAR